MTEHESFEQQIGRKIEAIRKIYEIEPDALCEKIGIPLKKLENYERGAESITLAHLYKITSVFNLSLSYFLKDW